MPVSNGVVVQLGTGYMAGGRVTRVGAIKARGLGLNSDLSPEYRSCMCYQILILSLF